MDVIDWLSLREEKVQDIIAILVWILMIIAYLIVKLIK